MDLRISEIQAFVAVVHCETFTTAAAYLNITQPALSRRIQSIEGVIGAPLFKRRKSGPTLTDLGREFLPYAEAALRTLEEGLNAAKSMATGDSGPVSLAAVGALCTERLVQALRGFQEENPGANLSLSFHADTSSEVSQAVLRGEAMLGLRFGVDTRLNSTVVGSDDVVLVCSPNHRLASAQDVSILDLRGETWITFPMAARHGAANFISRISPLGLNHQSVMMADSNTAQKRLIMGEFGIGLIARSSAVDEIESGRLAVVKLQREMAQTSVAVVRKKSTGMSPLLGRLADWISKSFPPPP